MGAPERLRLTEASVIVVEGLINNGKARVKCPQLLIVFDLGSIIFRCR